MKTKSIWFEGEFLSIISSVVNTWLTENPTCEIVSTAPYHNGQYYGLLVIYRELEIFTWQKPPLTKTKTNEISQPR